MTMEENRGASIEELTSRQPDWAVSLSGLVHKIGSVFLSGGARQAAPRPRELFALACLERRQAYYDGDDAHPSRSERVNQQ